MTQFAKSNKTMLVHEINTKEYHTYFYIPTELTVSWNPCSYNDFDPVNIEIFLNSVKQNIKSSQDIVVLWSAANRLDLTTDALRYIDSFALHISNPVLILDGSQLAHEHLNFIHTGFPYFEYVARTIWNAVDISGARTKACFMVGTKDYLTRKYLLSNLVNSGLADSSYVSYKQCVTAPLVGYSTHNTEQISAVANQIDHLLPWPPLDDSIEFNEIPRRFLLDSCVNIVTDTFFEGDIFVSEKVYTAIAHGQMFIMLAPAGTLSYLRSRGYQTFSNYIDESYDTIEDNYQRLVAVSNAVQSLAVQDIHQLYQQCQHIIQHNYQHFYNNNVNAEFVAFLQQAQQLKNGCP